MRRDIIIDDATLKLKSEFPFIKDAELDNEDNSMNKLYFKIKKSDIKMSTVINKKRIPCIYGFNTLILYKKLINDIVYLIQHDKNLKLLEFAVDGGDAVRIKLIDQFNYIFEFYMDEELCKINGRYLLKNVRDTLYYTLYRGIELEFGDKRLSRRFSNVEELPLLMDDMRNIIKERLCPCNE